MNSCQRDCKTNFNNKTQKKFQTMNPKKFVKVFHSNSSPNIIYATRIKVKSAGAVKTCYGMIRSDDKDLDKTWQWTDITDWYEEEILGSDRVLKIDLV